MLADMPREQVIRIQVDVHTDAPPKPPEGQPCNGCGLCCLAEPCPIGVVVSRRRHGACVALRWSGGQRRYLCGVLADAATRLAAARAAGWRGAPRRLLAAWWWRWVRRHIASGVGCDASLEPDA
ncbi:MAG: hypothetical protein RI907_3663 [Pseudomonadota bacterium]|jgi:hypothetical protein